MGEIKNVGVKTTDFSTISDAGELLTYIINSINEGKASVLFRIPNITTTIYNQGTFAKNALKKSIENAVQNPKKANFDIIKDKMRLVVIWLNKYSGKVVLISNDDANRSTTEEAATNIRTSHLTPQNLKKLSKGAPVKPILTGATINKTGLEVRISNIDVFKPASVTFILVERPAATNPPTKSPIITLINGQLKTQFFGNSSIIIQTINGKGEFIRFDGLNPLSQYDVYAYGQNGKKQISQLSDKITI